MDAPTWKWALRIIGLVILAVVAIVIAPFAAIGIAIGVCMWGVGEAIDWLDPVADDQKEGW